MYSLILYCCSCPALACANDVCLILLVPPLEQYHTLRPQCAVSKFEHNCVNRYTAIHTTIYNV